MSIRVIPIVGCSACPYREFHYGHHECRKMNFKELPEQKQENGKVTPPPDWCPLPLHPTANS